MLKNSTAILRAGMLALLLSALLLLPTFHTHPEQRHAHGHDTTHSHPAVVHADFFANPGHDGHDQGHDGPEGNSSRADFRVSLFTLLPRSLVLLTVALDRVPLPFFATAPVITTQPLARFRVHLSDHQPPVQIVSLAAISPRSPPHHA